MIWRAEWQKCLQSFLRRFVVSTGSPCWAVRLKMLSTLCGRLVLLQMKSTSVFLSFLFCVFVFFPLEIQRLGKLLLLKRGLNFQCLFSSDFKVSRHFCRAEREKIEFSQSVSHFGHMEFILLHMVPPHTSLVFFCFFFLFGDDKHNPSHLLQLSSDCWSAPLCVSSVSLLLQVTVTRRRAAPSSTAAMPPPRRASSTTARTWPCLRWTTIKHTLLQIHTHAHTHRQSGRKRDTLVRLLHQSNRKAPTSMNEGN